MKSYWNNIIDLYNFINKTFKYCTKLLELNPDNYQLLFDYDTTSNRLGLYKFPNRIYLFVNILSFMGANENANKTFIMETILHELYHSIQYIVKSNNRAYLNSIEYTVDSLAISVMEYYRDDILYNLHFKVDDETLDNIKLGIKGNDNQLIVRDSLYVYKNIINMIDKQFIFTFESLLESHDNIAIFINNIFDKSVFHRYIRYNGQIMSSIELANYVSSTIQNYTSYNGSKLYVIRTGDTSVINLTINNATILPFKQI